MIVALCASVGLQWCALQSVAWATMLVTKACHAPLAVAVAQTFDGAHPCDICHVVAEGKKSEKKSDILPAVMKVDMICYAQPVSYQPPATRYRYPYFSCLVTQRAETPLAPPPRFSLS